MLRNKWGLSKKDAQNLFYQYKTKGSSDEGDGNETPEPETVDQKIAVILDYMKDTSSKLDSIDRDIALLKKQVEEILKRL